MDPVTPSARAGVTAVPPAEPALPVTVAVPDWEATTEMLASAAGEVTVPSAMVARVSMPVTSTAMPAPTPTPPDEELEVVVLAPVALAAAFASATVLVQVLAEAVTESGPVPRATFAPSLTEASVSKPFTWTVMAPAMVLSPLVKPACDWASLEAMGVRAATTRPLALTVDCPLT